MHARHQCILCTNPHARPATLPSPMQRNTTTPKSATGTLRSLYVPASYLLPLVCGLDTDKRRIQSSKPSSPRQRPRPPQPQPPTASLSTAPSSNKASSTRPPRRTATPVTPASAGCIRPLVLFGMSSAMACGRSSIPGLRRRGWMLWLV